MKPIELLNKVSGSFDIEKDIKSKPIRFLFEKYLKEDCVIGYLQENIGVLFMIKGVRGHFLFYYLNKEVFNGVTYFDRVENDFTGRFGKAIELIKEKGKIINQDVFNEFQKRMVIKNLKK